MRADIDEDKHKNLEAKMVGQNEDVVLGDYDPNDYDTDDAGKEARLSDWNSPENQQTQEPLLQTQHYALAKDVGKWFAFRGKGPEWAPNTSSLDCTLVIALQLRIGGLLDRGPHLRKAEFTASLSPFHQLFYNDLTGTTWDENSADLNKNIRNSMFIELLNENQQADRNEFIPFPHRLESLYLVFPAAAIQFNA
ncbi:hypothetical protein MMC34_006681 [Xylographa carneopallida]|nr:hypothetical protein [Xylographa carneopallida]